MKFAFRPGPRVIASLGSFALAAQLTIAAGAAPTFEQPVKRVTTPPLALVVATPKPARAITTPALTLVTRLRRRSP